DGRENPARARGFEGGEIAGDHVTDRRRDGERSFVIGAAERFRIQQIDFAVLVRDGHQIAAALIEDDGRAGEFGFAGRELILQVEIFGIKSDYGIGEACGVVLTITGGGEDSSVRVERRADGAAAVRFPGMNGFVSEVHCPDAIRGTPAVVTGGGENVVLRKDEAGRVGVCRQEANGRSGIFTVRDQNHVEHTVTGHCEEAVAREWAAASAAASGAAPRTAACTSAASVCECGCYLYGAIAGLSHRALRSVPASSAAAESACARRRFTDRRGPADAGRHAPGHAAVPAG